ncbi:hypothetical protein F52700_10308 [Fusarium sp. NRRL 52700]|nr:hypothetical protein F52700_10308 [Fusarium sp. NRRL 52700]
MDDMRSLTSPAEPPLTQKKSPASKFLYFTKLCPDIRLLIWEAALRPRPSKNYNATHCCRVNIWEGTDPSLLKISVGQKSLPLFGSLVTKGLDHHKLREPMSNCSEGLKSVAHWDYGLWKACLESRWVISQRFRHKYWGQMKLAVLQDLKTIPAEIFVPFDMEVVWQMTDRLRENGPSVREGKWFKDFASVVNIDGMYDNIVATHPARDLFIIGNEQWKHVLKRQPTDREQEDKAVLIFGDNVISPTSHGSPIMSNIGFVFDDSWFNGITRFNNSRMSLTEAKTKNNPIGFFLLLLLHLMVVRVLGGMRLWLIDEKFNPCHICKTKKDAENDVEEKKRDREVFYRYGKEDLVEVDIKPNVTWVRTSIVATS